MRILCLMLTCRQTRSVLSAQPGFEVLYPARDNALDPNSTKAYSPGLTHLILEAMHEEDA